ncbi:hypothetical protein E2562_035787 [Oryza meyeriana var. granulata]|uniref:Uncharacterized protein n=1 Tax=Oryza meyeriana var. granulata TaxID=110450 RepID=A0A6G1CL26_9ORYZ|nr:hypothetical protein E2562_035787 [Oryza meyeriana var. granulata]
MPSMDLQLPPCSVPSPPSQSSLHLPRHSIPLHLPLGHPLGLPCPAAATAVEGSKPAATLQVAALGDGCGSVAVGDGRRGGQDGGAATLGVLTLKRDAHQAGGHLAHQRGHGRGELQQQLRARAQVELECEVYVVAPVAVERASEPRADGSELADPL